MGECNIVDAGAGGRRVPLAALALLVVLAVATGQRAMAQDTEASCTPSIARIVSLQGSVELRRSGADDWVPVRRLDTALCGDDRLRTGALSRAALFVQPETLVRVDQNTVITLRQSPDEIEVEFFAAELAEGLRDPMFRGAGYFITRFPKKFRVKTPHMNAAVEGTEFLVESNRDATRLTVLEGEVLSESVATRDRRLVTAGQSVESGVAGPGAITTVVRPLDAVQWVLRFPPLHDPTWSAEVLTEEQCQAMAESMRPSCLVESAELLLRQGRVDEASPRISRALALDPGHSDALALRSIIQVTKNERADAFDSARSALTANPGNYRAWLALSYAQQADFDLEEALASVTKAAALQPESSLAHARVAELHLALGRIGAAERSARTAVSVDPNDSHGHTLLGFIGLARIDTGAATASFTDAIGLDSFNALPRLGLGLARIREGKLASGREQLEIAVALDPGNSLMRSYVGKAYFEENTKERDGLAASQFGIAKELDSKDPTPWFYDAILLQSQNRPAWALDGLHDSLARNDNRVVYRSRLLLEDDAAARAASIATIYGDLGFEKLAIAESTKALAVSHRNASAHQQLAIAYANLPRHDIARVSEALQAQIRQPVSLSPVSPLLGTDNLAIARGAGPARSGVNEFNSLFNRNGMQVQVDGIVGGLDTFGNQFVASALADRFSYTLSQMHYETDGFTENDAVERDIYGLLVHGQVSANSSIQLEMKRSDVGIGQTMFPFDEFATPTTILERSDTFRASGHHILENESDIIWSGVVEDRDRAVRSFPDGGLFFASDATPFAAEVQFMDHLGEFALITGAGYVEDTEEFRPEAAQIRNESATVYAYAQWKPASDRLSVLFGLAAEQFDSRHTSEFSPVAEDLERDQLSPKLGLVWWPRVGTTVRAAAFSAVHRPFIRSQTIEPTQVAGFNQFFTGHEQIFGDFIGTISDRVGIGLDQAFSPTAFGGVEFSLRRLDVPSFVFSSDFTWREKAAHAYFYKTFAPLAGRGRSAGWQASVSAELEFEEIDRPQALTGAEGIMDLTSVRIPLGIRFFHGAGTTLRLGTTYVEQDGRFSIDVGLPVVESGDDAWITDLSVEHRLPKRRGFIAVGVRNLFDDAVNLLEIDPFNAREATQQFIYARLSLVF